jgi:hypothetical protein
LRRIRRAAVQLRPAGRRQEVEPLLKFKWVDRTLRRASLAGVWGGHGPDEHHGSPSAVAMRTLTPILIWAAIVCLAFLVQWGWNDAWSIQRASGAGGFGWGLIGGGLVVAVIVSRVTSSIQSRLAARAEIMRCGVATSARVVKLEQLGSGEDSSYAYVEVLVVFETSEGRPQEAAARFNLGYVHAPRYQPGSTICVYYDPAVPTRVAVEDAV